ncbi:MAG: hypothetical protein QXO22_04310 [Thermosphaera sp.]
MVRVVRQHVRLVVNGKPIKVRRIITTTPTHVVVEHLDGHVELIPIESLEQRKDAVLV